MTATGNFIFICPACGYKARLPDQFSGRTIKCPGCQVPQVATAPLNTEHKTASFIRVAATPVPFSMPQEQIDALAGAPSAQPAALPLIVPQTAPKAFPSPLPGAIQVTTDRITNQTTTVPTSTGRVAKVVQGGTVDFTCNSCNARLRLPAHYAGKSILCPKCSTPQKVLVSNAAEPMDTTRSIALRGDISGATPLNPGAKSEPSTGTGIRVRVTPLPSTYPTPLPTTITSPQTDVLAPQRSIASTGVAPEKTPPMGDLTPIASPHAMPAPVTQSIAELSSVVDEIVAGSLGDAGDEAAPVKPHPSRGKLKTEAIKRPAPNPSPVPMASAAAAPVNPGAKSPLGLIAAAGALLVIAIALGAGLAYYALALGETRSRLEEAQRIAKESAEREHTAIKSANDLNTRIAALEAELEAALKTATDKAESDKAAAEKAALENPVVAPDEPPVEPVIPAPVEEPPK